MSKFQSCTSNRFGTFQKTNMDINKYIKPNQCIKKIYDVELPVSSEDLTFEEIYTKNNEEVKLSEENPMNFTEISTFQIPETKEEPVYETKPKNTKLKDVVEYIIAKERLDKIIQKKSW